MQEGAEPVEVESRRWLTQALTQALRPLPPFNQMLQTPLQSEVKQQPRCRGEVLHNRSMEAVAKERLLHLHVIFLQREATEGHLEYGCVPTQGLIIP